MIGEKVKWRYGATITEGTVIGIAVSGGYSKILAADETGNIHAFEYSNLISIDMNNPFSNIFGRRKKKETKLPYSFTGSSVGYKYDPQNSSESVIPLSSLGNFSDSNFIGGITNDNNSDSFSGFGGGDTGGGGASGSWDSDSGGDSSSCDSGSSDSGSSDSGGGSSD